MSAAPIPPFVPARRPAPRWLVFTATATCLLTGFGAGHLASTGRVQQQQRQAVQACDAGWEACRTSMGLPVASVGGCVWRHRDPTYHATEFGKLGPDGKWIACKWTDEPDEEAEEDESSCGVGWRVCFDKVNGR